MAKVSAFLSTLGAVAATGHSDFLSDLYSGKVSKNQVELVLAQHDEDVAWSEPLSSVRTVYCKGTAGATAAARSQNPSQCSADAVQLPNVGREGHTFLHHIVNNYDSLANWTVFSQAQAPSEGYVNHRVGGGHLLSGITMDDYLAHHNNTEGKADSLFLMSSKVHMGTLRHALRSTYKVHEDQQTPKLSSASEACPKESGEDVWGAYHDVPQLKKLISAKCGVEEHSLGAAIRSFWEDLVQLPIPPREVIHYSQGARFAVSRDRLRQRSKAYYQGLLNSISLEQDPCLSYLYEFSWYYITGASSTAPCTTSVEDATVISSPARYLQEGTSGVSGDGGDEGENPVAGTVRSSAMALSALVTAAALALSA